ncbi:hypothetical protein ACHAXT_002669 [Thalassiosira profunda]
MDEFDAEFEFRGGGDALRFLQEDNSDSTNNSEPLTQTEIIRSTCAVYVSLSAALYLVYLLLRPRFPRVYNLKKSFPALHVPVADDPFGLLSWTWRVFDVDYADIREQCGMDAATTVRLLESGVKLSLVAVMNSAYLVPVYAILGDVVASEGISDPVKGMSLSNLAQGHPGAFATTVAAYVFFGAAMYFVHVDFAWFAAHRREFLSKRTVQNYSVFLSGLPPEMQSNVALREYFGRCFGRDDAVADARVALKIPQLQKKAAKRDKIAPKLEHARNVVEVKGGAPMHKTKLCGGEKVESVPTYEAELEELKREIAEDIHGIEQRQNEREANPSGSGEGGGTNGDVEAGEAVTTSLLPEEESEEGEAPNGRGRASAVLSEVSSAGSALKSAVSASVAKLIAKNDDGRPRNAAFVSFGSLAHANLARQAIHDPEPWGSVPREPPVPKLVNWKNVGRSNKSKQLGELISLALTATLCIFWTIPVSFVASLSNVEALTELIPALQEPVEKYDWFAALLAILAPLILVVFISILPHIILAFVKIEGHIEMETMQHPSLFFKLAAFTIIQTFFISTIASTLFSSLQAIIDDPTSAVTLVAEALPAQSSYFIQYQIIIVQNLLPLGIELLRISPVGQNIARKFVANRLGHNLTEKERSETFLGLRSLDDPLEYYFGRELGSKTILAVMVLYVYGCIAPITSYFTLLVFGTLAVGFRNQFIFIYPTANDSGGNLFLNFTKISECFVEGILLVPLIVGTILFNVYYKRRHYMVTRFLPLEECAHIDIASESAGETDEWLKDVYLQPALKRAVPDADTGVPFDLPMSTLADEHKERGNAHMAAKEYQMALREYSEAIAISGGAGEHSHIFYSNRAACHCYMADYDAAADDCRKSIELCPDYEKAYTRLGLSLYFKGDYKGAVEAYKKALNLNPDNQQTFDYMVKAKEKMAAEQDDEFESRASFGGGGGLNLSRSFDPSIVNED